VRAYSSTENVENKKKKTQEPVENETSRRKKKAYKTEARGEAWQKDEKIRECIKTFLYP
jgi:hypothetical protein